MIRRIPWWVWLSANLVALPSWAAEASEPSEEKSLGYWGDQPARPFVSGEVAVGAMNVVEVAAGYGKPHFLWAGVKADGIVTTDFASTSAGLRLNGLLLNAYAGVRRTVAFSHRFPVVKEAYTKEDIKDDGQPRLRYTSFDGVLSGVVPAGPIVGFWGARGVWMLDAPSGQAVFSEFFRYTAHEPRAFLVHTAWWWRFMNDALLVGPAADLAATPGRDPVVRVGGSVLVALGPHLSCDVIGTFPVSSPDPALGALFQAWGTAVLRWRWATGDPHPAFF